MQLCFKNKKTKERFDQKWHLKYVWFPWFYLFTDKTRCFIWLGYVQRRYKYTIYGFVNKYGYWGREYKNERELG